MAHGKDYLPRKEADLLAWLDNFLKQVAANSAVLGLNLADMAPLVEKYNVFKPLHQKCTGAERTKTLVAQKNAAKADLIAELRAFVLYRFAAPGVTDALRVQCGLPPRDHIRTSQGVPTTRPEFELRDKDFRRLSVEFWDQAGKSKAKPYGMSGAVISWLVADAPPPDQQSLAKSAMATRTPHTLEFTEEERGKTVYVALQWQNAKGDKGPFSEILSAVIP